MVLGLGVVLTFRDVVVESIFVVVVVVSVVLVVLGVVVVLDCVVTSAVVGDLVAVA